MDQDECKKELGISADKLKIFRKKFGTERDCRRYLYYERWPDGYKCPNCGHEERYKHKKRKLYQCKKCEYQTSVTSSTIFDKTRKELSIWFEMILLVVQKKHLKTKIIQKHFKMNYKTVWRMRKKIEATLLKNNAHRKLFGLVNEKKIDAARERLSNRNPRFKKKLRNMQDERRMKKRSGKDRK